MRRLDWADPWVKLIGATAAGIALILGSFAAAGGFDNDDCGTCERPPVVKTQLDGVEPPDADNQLEPAEVAEQDVGEVNLANVGPDYEEDQRDELPPGVTPEERQEAYVTPPNPLPADEEYRPQPVGGAQSFSCPTNYVRNSSPRTVGTVVSQWVLHITVSSPGSLRAIWNLFNTASFGASSTYLLELDKECEQIVPFGNRPWTQLTFNNVSESVEIVTNLMTKNEWLASPIIRDGTLAELTVSRLKARGLPPRHVDPVGCTPQAGYMDHDDLECGNNHIDVGDEFPWAEFGRDVRQIYAHGTLCNAACRRVERRERLHRKTHRHYRRHAKAGECKRHPHKVKASELHKPHCRALKVKIHKQHKAIARAKRTLASSS